MQTLLSGACYTQLKDVLQDLESCEDDCDKRKFLDWLQFCLQSELKERRGFEMIHPCFISKLSVDINDTEWIAYTKNEDGEFQIAGKGLIFKTDTISEIHNRVYYSLAKKLN